MAELHFNEIDERELDTVLAEDINFTGEMTFTKPLMIKGHFRGDIKATGDLFVGPEALVEAKIQAKNVNLRGTIKGNIMAEVQIELHSGSRVDGDMTCPEIIMEPGAKFNGICTMPEKKETSHV
ncbi:MAG: cell shape determination protein CcmA [Spirochaetes bacterium GWB1_48_6]|nr:MAG: cell shape determination protein CcmA [Spirochaetes bacterium GWB1_48_6]